MRSSKNHKDRTGGWQRAVVVVAVGALLAAVVWSSPSVVWLIAAVAAAAAVVIATLSIGRNAGASAGNDQIDSAANDSTPDQVRFDGSAEPARADRDEHSVSAFVVSLARRNGGLVDQQLALLDTLEASVEDPDLLANYFKLDHLATRMRRNADSLLVLAGVDRPGMRAPQAIDEVVRAGISEIEDYRRIDVLALEDVQVTGLAATTLGHLVAELLDNATAFSPPEARVRIAGNAVSTGYEILVADSGIGISDARIDDLNRKLALPPESGAVGDASIGLTVVAMLAARIGATVRLAGSEHGGTIATVHIPSTVLHGDEPAGLADPRVTLVAEPTPSYTPSRVLDSSPAPMASLVVEASHQPMASPLVEATPFVEAGPVIQLREFDGAGSFAPAAPSTYAGSPMPAGAEVAAPSVADPAIDTSSTLAREAADAIARLTLTVSGLPVRPTQTTDAEEHATPSRTDGTMVFWPPPVPTPDNAFASPPTALSTALGSLQTADSTEPRPVVEAHADRIGSAMSSFARQRGPAPHESAWDDNAWTDRERSDRTAF